MPKIFNYHLMDSRRDYPLQQQFPLCQGSPSGVFGASDFYCCSLDYTEQYASRVAVSDAQVTRLGAVAVREVVEEESFEYFVLWGEKVTR